MKLQLCLQRTPTLSCCPAAHSVTLGNITLAVPLCYLQGGGGVSPSRGEALPGSALTEGRAELSQSAGSSVQVCPGQLHHQASSPGPRWPRASDEWQPGHPSPRLHVGGGARGDKLLVGKKVCGEGGCLQIS